MNDSWSAPIERVLPEVVAIRHDLHAHPELNFAEHNTSDKIREALAKLTNLTVLPPLAKTDVVVVLNGDRPGLSPGRCLGLRADMDALPIEEQTNVEYKSTVPGVMHACGHDGHIAILLGTVMVLSQLADSLPGKVVFIFQPAEEEGGGAGVLCERGVLDSPKVDAIVAMHGWTDHPVGVVSARPGAIMAANSTFEIIVHGQGAHGAFPHRGIDPIVVSAHIITALQTIVARTVDPVDAAVVTVGQIAGGSAVNVIPLECRMSGTIRHARPEVGEHLFQQIRRIAEDTAHAHGATADVSIEPCYPPTINDPKLTCLVQDVARDLLGDKNLVTDDPLTMGAEDFSFYGQHVPAVMFFLGLRPAGHKTCPNLHSPTFDFNDAALPVGIRMFCEITQRFLHRAT